MERRAVLKLLIGSAALREWRDSIIYKGKTRRKDETETNIPLFIEHKGTLKENKQEEENTTTKTE